MSQIMKDAEFAPPYMSFETFRNFVQRLNPEAMPPRIDRSMMLGMAGGTQTSLMQLLKQFGLIGEANEVCPPLLKMTQNDEAFAQVLREILQQYYAKQLMLARQQGTPAQLSESFGPWGYSGSTLRKAVTFFLHAAKAADLPLSPHFRPPKTTPTTSRARRPRPKSAELPGPDAVSSFTPGGSESHTIALSSGGTVTVSCTASFLALSREDRNFLFQLVDQLKDYAADAQAAPAAGRRQSAENGH